MFSTAIVIFREIVEIALILGVVLAATRGLIGRMKWIIGGFAGGLGGAGLVAVFAGAISDAASGMGQELFNAMILFAAALVIGWTVLWMKGHARELSMHLRQVGHDVRDGKLPFYSLSLIIGLAMLREGSEIVLFIYGMALSGQTASSIVTGSAVGIVSGIIVGTLFYYGLLRLPARHMLTATSWLLILLVAGLTSQGIGFLTAAGYFTNYSQQLWDSSSILSESSIFGKAMHSLIGYSAHPTAVQLAVYLGVLTVLVIAANLINHRTNMKLKMAVAAFGAFMLCSIPAKAIDKVYDPYVNKGEAEVEFNGNRTSDGSKDKNNIQGYEIELGYSPTDFWKIEVSNVFERGSGEPKVERDIEVENKFQLTQPGEYWLDAGLLLAYAKALHKDDADKLETKLLLQKDFGKFSSLANIGLEQGLGDENHGGPDFSVEWNNRYRLNEYFQPGIEYQGDFGQTNHHANFNNGEHYIGPSIYGKIFSGEGFGDIGYRAVYLFGISDASSHSAARLMLEYETYF